MTNQAKRSSPAVAPTDRVSRAAGQGAAGITAMVLLSLACGGGGTGPSNNGGGGGGGGNVTISGISPASPYLGDTVTISGSGFSTVPSENLVKLASCAPTCSPASPFAMTVLTATATQLKVAIPWNYPSGLKPGAALLKVIVNGDSAITADTVYFKFPPVILSVINHDFGAAPAYAVRGGDLIQISLYGVLPDKNQMTVTVHGSPFPIDSVRPAPFGLEGGGAIFARLPVEVYPAGYQPTDIINDTAYVQLGISIRGRHDTLTYRAWRFPKSRIDQSVSGTYSFGTSAPAEVTGSNMPGPFAIVFAPTDTLRTIRTVGIQACQDLCDVVPFTIPGDLAPGGWFVHLKFERLVGEPTHLVGQITMQ